jgi:hypothetical protein
MGRGTATRRAGVEGSSDRGPSGPGWRGFAQSQDPFGAGPAVAQDFLGRNAEHREPPGLQPLVSVFSSRLAESLGGVKLSTVTSVLFLFLRRESAMTDCH